MDDRTLKCSPKFPAVQGDFLVCQSGKGPLEWSHIIHPLLSQMRKEMPEIYVTCLRVHSWVKAPAEGTLGSLCTARPVESANPFLETQEYWHQSKSCLTSGVIFCKHLLIGFANLRPLWSFPLISLVQCISSSIKIIVFLPWHTNTLSWPHLLTPLSTEAIKLSASPVTRARRTALVLCLPCGEICGCPTDELSLEINDPDRGLGAESASLVGLVLIRMDACLPLTT